MVDNIVNIGDLRNTSEIDGYGEEYCDWLEESLLTLSYKTEVNNAELRVKQLVTHNCELITTIRIIQNSPKYVFKALQSPEIITAQVLMDSMALGLGVNALAVICSRIICTSAGLLQWNSNHTPGIIRHLDDVSREVHFEFFFVWNSEQLLSVLTQIKKFEEE